MTRKAMRKVLTGSSRAMYRNRKVRERMNGKGLSEEALRSDVAVMRNRRRNRNLLGAVEGMVELIRVERKRKEMNMEFPTLFGRVETLKEPWVPRMLEMAKEMAMVERTTIMREIRMIVARMTAFNKAVEIAMPIMHTEPGTFCKRT
jgi:hypothetical protein